MKQYFSNILRLLILVTLLTGCKKFLNIDPPSNLSGNNFWRTKADVEAFTNGNYELLRESVTRPDLTAPAGTDEYPYFLFVGDLRGAPVIRNTNWDRIYIDWLKNNDLRAFFSDPNGYWQFTIWKMYRFAIWDQFYKVIGSANIAVDRIPDVVDPGMTDAAKKQYIAEAVFLRNFVYFLMVRQWGDVIYYTNPYNTKPMPRTNMVQVLKSCVEDMNAVYKDLPWTYENPVYVAVRAMRGSALALLMHMNMWLAAFDQAHAPAYYQEVVKYGKELVEQNEGNYQLLPLSRTSEIFKGRSKEGLFEIPQNKNYNESFGWGTYYDHTKKPIQNLTSQSYPYIFYTKKFMEDIYPQNVTDNRKSVWYDAGTLYNENYTFYIKKFLISVDENSPDNAAFDASQTVFRYSDAILLYGEALAELGEDDEAIRITGLVRTRAGAPALDGSGQKLKDQIYLERCRELMGEGHWWFDLVRTKRILNNPYGYTATLSQFMNGCWTWPINRDAGLNNPYLTLNTYWQ